MRPSLSGAVSNGGSGGIYEKNCNLINIAKETTVTMTGLHAHQISQEGEVTEINSGKTTPLLSKARARKRGAGE
jgi:hypothetical protein